MLIQQRGSGLLELIVAAALGLLIIGSLQQVWAWQQGKQQQTASATRSVLTAQSLIQQLTSDIEDSIPEQINLQGPCFLLPQHSGRLIGYRVKNRQLQRHTLAPHCPSSGWQSLSHYSSLAIKELNFSLQENSAALPVLSLSLLAKSPKSEEYHAFNRELVLTHAE